MVAPRLARLSRRVSLRLLAHSRPNMISRTSSGVTERTLGAFWSVETNLSPVARRHSSFVRPRAVAAPWREKSDYRAGVGIQ